jgi:hypothetical protein
MNHHTAPALEDLASEFGIIVDDMFIPAGEDGICPCRFGFAGESGLCESCYEDLMWYTEATYVDPQETFDYWEVQEWAF